MIFCANSLPLPNSSRTILTMSSAWLSSLAKIRVLGTSVRPGKISVNSLSRKVRINGADLVHGHHVAVELVGVVGELFVQLLPAHLARELVAQVHVVARLRPCRPPRSSAVRMR